MNPTVSRADRRLLLALGGAVLLTIVAMSLLAPSTAVNDPRPSSYNPAPGGAKAAYLMLEAMGRPVGRWEQPLDELGADEAARTTLILAEPLYSALEKDRLAASVHTFLEHGGRLLTTGASGALLLPGGVVEASRRLQALCYTDPEGPGVLARAGHVEMRDAVRWTETRPTEPQHLQQDPHQGLHQGPQQGPQQGLQHDPRSELRLDLRVEQRCGQDAVVVRLRVGRGEAVWWSSAVPLTNAELHNDADLKLLLASLASGSGSGAGSASAPVRRVLFDESLQQPVRSKWTAAQGLPLWSLAAQAALVFSLLIFSFSRRRGPVRLPVALPRSSPVEFAASMGHLYERAGATGVPISAAKRRLGRALAREGSLPPRAMEGDPAGTAAALAERFGGDWHNLAEHLRAAEATADTPLRARSALALVRALDEDTRRVQAAAHPDYSDEPDR